MTEPAATGPPWDQAHGWRVLDTDGNVVAAGPAVQLEMATSMDASTGTPDGEG